MSLGPNTLDDIVPTVRGLKERNKALESVLRSVVDVLGAPVEPTINDTTKKRIKKKKKKEKKKEGFKWCGKDGNFDAYRCKQCLSVVRHDHLDKHRCLERNKKRKRGKDIIEERKKKKKGRLEIVPKEINGFTRHIGKKETVSVFYRCDRCDYIIMESSIPSHVCTMPVEAVVAELFVDEEEDEEEKDRDDPKFDGIIAGWTWCEYRHHYSCYRCDNCHIVMRHDYIQNHRCPLKVVEKAVVVVLRDDSDDLYEI